VPLTGLAVSLAAFAASTAPEKPTFSNDVAPILFDRCVSCHRPGEAAPMSFTSYQLVRPWVKAIRDQVVARNMPVWLADPHSGSFKNDRRLSQVEIDTIVNWVSTGAPEGERQMFTLAAKADEPGLIEAARLLGAELTALSLAALNAQVGRILTPSAAARARFGAPNIAEAAALAGAGEGGRLIGPRLKADGATCAVALSSERPILERR